MREWLKSTLSHYGEPSTKRQIVAVASMTLCGITAAIGCACAVWIHVHGDLGAGAVGALTFAGGITAALAGNAYRKPDGVKAPPAPSSVVSGNSPAGSDKNG